MLLGKQLWVIALSVFLDGELPAYGPVALTADLCFLAPTPVSASVIYLTSQFMSAYAGEL